DHAVLDDLALLDAHLHHERGDALGAEQAHEVVLERQEEPRRAGVALAAGPAAQLPVDAARLVPLGAADGQPAQVRDAGPQLDVGAAAGHVRGDRHGAALARVRDDLGFLLVVLRIQYVVGYATDLEEA